MEHLFAKKSLGQNFLRSSKALSQILEAAELNTQDIVLEIGPGEGVLTEKLLEKSRLVIAIEKDDRLIPILQEKFSSEILSGKFILIHGDILDIPFESIVDQKNAASKTSLLQQEKYKVVANIPYYITGLLLPLILSHKTHPSLAVFLVQKEVAERIVARDGKESILSMSVQVYGKPQFISKVPRGAFVPPPNVDSAIIKISDISKDFFTEISEQQFFETVKKGFAHKRKLLKGNLRLTDEQLEKIGIPVKARAEELTLSDWKLLTKVLAGLL